MSEHGITMIAMDTEAINYRFMRSHTGDEGSMLWDELIFVWFTIPNRYTYTYHTFLATPFCIDGYKHEMTPLLEDQGWARGMGGLTYREDVTVEDLVRAITYIKAYRQAYHTLYPIGSKYHGLSNVDLSLRDFLQRIDTIYETLQIVQITNEGVMDYLTTRGFTMLEITDGGE